MQFLVFLVLLCPNPGSVPLFNVGTHTSISSPRAFLLAECHSILSWLWLILLSLQRDGRDSFRVTGSPRYKNSKPGCWRRTSHCPMFTGPSFFTQLLPPDSLSFLYTEPWQTYRADPGSSTPPWPLYNPQKSANISVFYFFLMHVVWLGFLKQNKISGILSHYIVKFGGNWFFFCSFLFVSYADWFLSTWHKSRHELEASVRLITG